MPRLAHGPANLGSAGVGIACEHDDVGRGRVVQRFEGGGRARAGLQLRLSDLSPKCGEGFDEVGGIVLPTRIGDDESRFGVEIVRDEFCQCLARTSADGESRT